jgi:hypothetical protein
MGAQNPVYNGVACFGEDLSNEHRLRQLELKWLIKTYDYNKQSEVLQSFYKTGRNTKTQQQIEDGKSEADIRKSWKPV